MDESSPTNTPELTVSELATNLKRTIETNFDHVRVRGELGRVTIARSGHMYADIKDEKAVLNTVMWKGQVSALPFRPEEGLEIVATGKLSIYAGRSNYQLIASSMRPAGVGALMALLEERRKKLAAEGLFDGDHKKPLPRLPRTIGVITSPTGAVIRDILHRIRDRFPVRVILWPALVQGDLAATQIEAGIRGFNDMSAADRPDVLIVGRGGGSIEDLWPFNEENVVRAAFESSIPLISAVGHETDTTLIDFVSDARAPTPTGAAEIAVPVRSELLLNNQELGQRLARALQQRVRKGQDALKAARLPRAEGLLDRSRQRLDYAGSALPRAVLASVHRSRSRFDRSAIGLPRPDRLIREAGMALERAALRLSSTLKDSLQVKRLSYSRAASGLRHDPVRRETIRARRDLVALAKRARPALDRRLAALTDRLEVASKLLTTLSYEATLDRGYALVRDDAGTIIRSAGLAKSQSALAIEFADGALRAIPETEDQALDRPRAKAQTKLKAKASFSKKTTKDNQGDLF